MTNISQICHEINTNGIYFYVQLGNTVSQWKYFTPKRALNYNTLAKANYMTLQVLLKMPLPPGYNFNFGRK